MREARLASELEALERDRSRLLDERVAAEADVASGRRSMAVPVPPRDVEVEAALSAAERDLAEGLAELGTLRGAQQAHGQAWAAQQRAAAAREAEAETARRRLAEIERRSTEEAGQAAAIGDRRTEAEAALIDARAALSATVESERAAATEGETRRVTAATAEASRAAAVARAGAADASRAAVRARLDALEQRLTDEEVRGIARAAIRAGGRRLDEDLSIDPALRAAAGAALAEATRAYVVASDAVAGLAGERGTLVVAERTAETTADDARERRFRATVAAAGGGTLDGAVRHDPTGAARRILSRAAWLPDLAACLAVQADVPPGWIVVPRDGTATVGELGVSLGASESDTGTSCRGDPPGGRAHSARCGGGHGSIHGGCRDRGGGNGPGGRGRGARDREPGRGRPSSRRGGRTGRGPPGRGGRT